MALRSALRRGRGRGSAAGGTVVFALVAVLVTLPRVASAVPSFASQTGLPCAQCHVMAFGPQLTEYGRQFKLNGYTFAKQDGGLRIPLAVTAIAGYQSVSKAAPTPQPFSDKDNLALQEASVYFAGRITDHLGAFVKATYDNIFDTKSWDTLDVRYARPVDLGGHSAVLGLDVNNYPKAQDLWNNVSIWSFPYIQPELVPFPNTAPVIRGRFGNTVLGASVYSMIDNRVYAELGFYRGLTDKWLGDLGDAGADPHIVGAAPYARISVQQHAGPQYFQLGAVYFSVKQQPFASISQTNRFTDYGLDGSYQWNVGAANAIDAHASWIHEDRSLGASFANGGSAATANSLDSFQADVTYILQQTWSGSLGLFATNGTTNRLMFAPGAVFGSASGSPANRGYTLQLEWVPFGKSGSFAAPWVNVRLGLQYTGYWRFNGGSSNYDGFGRSASDNNTLFLFTWLAF